MPKVVAAGSSGHGGAGRRRRPKVTTPMMQQGLNVNLPAQRRAPPMPPANDPIYVTVPVTFARNRLVQLGNENIRLEVLAERIRQRVENRDDKQVFLRSDGAVTMQQ